MKTLLRVDLVVQILLYLLFVVGIISWLVNVDDFIFLVLYFFIGMGVWQLLSAIVLMLVEGVKQRMAYLLSAVIFLLMSVLLTQIPFLYFGIAFGFSVWYFTITLRQLKSLENLPKPFWDLEF